MAEIRLDHLRHSYFARPQAPGDYALKGVDMVLEEGLAYAILGPSGSGKTTLLNILSGLLAPSEGRILFDDQDVTGLGARERNIAQVFQFPVIYETMTVRENLAFPLRTRRVDSQAIAARVRLVAGELGLTAVLDRMARALTAEQKQRISLGRGLVREDVAAILLDEPLTVIDPAEKLALRKVLKAVQSHLGLKLIYVTHDQHEAMTLADRVIVMDDGAIVQSGTPQELFERPMHRFVGYFIGTPGMNFLDCIVETGGVRVAGGFVALGEAKHRKLASARGQKRLGIRPDFISIVPSPEADIVGTVAEVHDRGDDSIITVEADGQRVLVLGNDEVSPRLGDQVNLALDRRFIRFFDDDIAIELGDDKAKAQPHE
jgi:glycerol transport system ATP-binding protein